MGKRITAGILAAVFLAASLPGGALAAQPLPEQNQTAAGWQAESDTLALLTDELGNAMAFGYDSTEGLLRWLQGPEDTEQTRTWYGYDAQQRLASVEKAAGGLAGGLETIWTRYRYEGDQLTAIEHSNTSEASTLYRFVYDEAGRLTRTQAGGRTLAEYSYEGEQLAGAAYGNGDTVTYRYDAAGRLAASQWNGGAEETLYTYDESGRQASVLQSGTGLETRYRYDEAGRLTATEQTLDGETHGVEWTYDGQNNLTGITESQNGETAAAAFRYDEEGRVSAVTAGPVTALYTYQEAGALEGQELLYEGTPAVTCAVEYLLAADGAASSRVAAWTIRTADGTGRTCRYAYDANGNIQSISDGINTTSYEYDGAGQLVRENNRQAGKSWTWTYDAGGNILQKAEYAYTEGVLGEPERTVDYEYGDSQWGDLLQGCGGQAMETDATGSLLSDGRWTYRWTHGRQLAGMSDGDRELAFLYGADGLRIQKTVGSTVWRYTYVDGRLTSLTDGVSRLRFGYDAGGVAFVNYNGADYFYLKNMQGDILGLADAAGEWVVEYTYDAWGAPLAVTGRLADTLGQINPLRYRGYIWDPETGLYYLGSRYYNPELGRFLSADEGIAAPGGALLGGNLFAYGLNNPVNTSDPEGSWPRWVTGGFAALSALQAMQGGSIQQALTALTALAVYRLQVIHFDIREALNVDIPLTREEAIAAGWFGPDTDPVGPSALLHQFTSKIFGENVKYVSPDGCREAIYDAWGRLVADVRDIGTYNFAPSGTLWGNIRHFFLDVLPWVIFGNGDGDPGPLVDGLIRLFK